MVMKSGQCTEVVSKKKKSYKLDLRDIEKLNEISKKLPDRFILIHTAASAHEDSFLSKKDNYNNNVTITKNLINVLSEKIVIFIFLSSVSVYGEAGHRSPIGIKCSLNPSNQYGRSKLECERLIIQSKIKLFFILRLAPVFNKTHLNDVKKRIILPLFKSTKIIIKPNPKHSFLSIGTLNNIIVNIIENKKIEKITNVYDSRPYSQLEISDWFEGKTLFFPEILFRPFYWLSYLFPNRIGYSLRCYYWKFFKSNIYK